MLKYNGYENGPILRGIRKQKNLTVDKVCEITGISTSTLNQIEQGGRNLSMRTLFVLMEAYEVDANTMLNIPSINNEESIDKKLNDLSHTQRDYLRKSFLFMLEQAERFAEE